MLPPMTHRHAAFAAAGLLAAWAFAHSAQAQEIQLSGPLMAAPDPPSIHYRAIAIRGELLALASFAGLAAPGHTTSLSQGIGGGVRYRASHWLALELNGAFAYGLYDATETRIPLSARGVLIDAFRAPPWWEFFVAAGPSVEHLERHAGKLDALGFEASVGLDRRVDPQWNRYVVELVLAERAPLGSTAGFSTEIMLRVGVANTIGYTQVGRKH